MKQQKQLEQEIVELFVKRKGIVDRIRIKPLDLKHDIYNYSILPVIAFIIGYIRWQ